MADILLRQSLTRKDVAEMRPAMSAANLRSLPIWVEPPLNCPRNLLVKAGPATVRIKLISRAVEGRFAPPAEVSARRKMTIILARKGSFRAPVDYHLLFFWRKRIKLHASSIHLAKHGRLAGIHPRALSCEYETNRISNYQRGAG